VDAQMNESLLHRAEKMWNRGRRRPIKIFLFSLFSALLFVVFCGGSLWIPVSRLDNITLKNFLTPIADAAAVPGQLLKVDTYVPEIRLKFVKEAGLSENPNWDTTFFNNRDVASKSDIAKLSETTETIEKIEPVEAAVPEDTKVVYSATNPLKLYIFGDSQITGLGAGFDRLTKNIPQIEAEHLGIISSGFIRDEYYNWSAKLADVTSKKHYDAAVFMLGMNDNIDFADSDGNPIYRETPQWEEYYTKRCCALLDQITAEFGKVYWLGMPKPRSSKYDEHLIYIDAIHEKIAKNYDSNVLIRVSVRDIFPGKGKKYRDNNYFPDGSVLRVMGDDGIHLTIAGGQWVMNSVYQKIISDFDFENPLPDVIVEN
jgi:hypothetical protein